MKKLSLTLSSLIIIILISFSFSYSNEKNINNGKAIIGKVDVDSNRELALQYNVRSIPSLMIFKEGEMIDSLMGAVSLEELEDLVTRNF